MGAMKQLAIARDEATYHGQLSLLRDELAEARYDLARAQAALRDEQLHNEYLQTLLSEAGVKP